MIFFLIAGTATPAFFLAVPGDFGRDCLIVLWTVTLVAVMVHLAWMRAPEIVVGAAFVGLGWAAGLSLPEVWIHAGVVPGALMLAGGLLYTGGGFLSPPAARPLPVRVRLSTSSFTPASVPRQRASSWRSPCSSAGPSAVRHPPRPCPTGPGTKAAGRLRRPARCLRPAEKVAILVAMTVSEQMPLAEVKNRLSEVVERLEREHGRVVITKHGHAAAVVMSVEDLESLEETLDVMGSEALLADIRGALADLATGEAPVLSKDEALRMITRQ